MKKNLKEAMVVVCFLALLVVGTVVQRPKEVVLSFDFSRLIENNHVIREVYVPEGSYKVFWERDSAGYEDKTKERLVYIFSQSPRRKSIGQEIGWVMKMELRKYYWNRRK